MQPQPNNNFNDQQSRGGGQQNNPQNHQQWINQQITGAYHPGQQRLQQPPVQQPPNPNHGMLNFAQQQAANAANLQMIQMNQRGINGAINNVPGRVQQPMQIGQNLVVGQQQQQRRVQQMNAMQQNFPQHRNAPQQNLNNPPGQSSSQQLQIQQLQNLLRQQQMAQRNKAANTSVGQMQQPKNDIQQHQGSLQQMLQQRQQRQQSLDMSRAGGNQIAHQTPKPLHVDQNPATFQPTTLRRGSNVQIGAKHSNLLQMQHQQQINANQHIQQQRRLSEMSSGSGGGGRQQTSNQQIQQQRRLSAGGARGPSAMNVNINVNQQMQNRRMSEMSVNAQQQQQQQALSIAQQRRMSGMSEMSVSIQPQQPAMSMANAQPRRLSKMSVGVQPLQQSMSIANSQRRRMSEIRVGGQQQQAMSIANPQQQQTPVPVQNVGLQMHQLTQHPPNDRQRSVASESSSHSNQQALLRNIHPEAQKLRNNQQIAILSQNRQRAQLMGQPQQQQNALAMAASQTRTGNMVGRQGPNGMESSSLSQFQQQQIQQQQLQNLMNQQQRSSASSQQLLQSLSQHGPPNAKRSNSNTSSQMVNDILNSRSPLELSQTNRPPSTFSATTRPPSNHSPTNRPPSAVNVDATRRMSHLSPSGASPNEHGMQLNPPGAMMPSVQIPARPPSQQHQRESAQNRAQLAQQLLLHQMKLAQKDQAAQGSQPSREVGKNFYVPVSKERPASESANAPPREDKSDQMNLLAGIAQLLKQQRSSIQMTVPQNLQNRQEPAQMPQVQNNLQNQNLTQGLKNMHALPSALVQQNQGGIINNSAQPRSINQAPSLMPPQIDSVQTNHVSLQSFNNTQPDIDLLDIEPEPIHFNNAPSASQGPGLALPNFGVATQDPKQNTLQTAPAAKPAKPTKPPDAKGKRKAKRRASVVHVSPFSCQEVKDLASKLSTPEKVVWVTKQVLGHGGTNGFARATSKCQTLKKTRARSIKAKESGTDDMEQFLREEEQLKKKIFDVRTAKKMTSELQQGLQFCNLITDVIRTVFEEICPDNPLLLVQPPIVAPPQDLLGMPSFVDMLSKPPAKPKSDSKKSKSRKRKADDQASSSDKAQQSHAKRRSSGAQTVAEGNPEGSTLRKLRKRRSQSPAQISAKTADLAFQQLVGDHDDDGRPLSKRELSHRLFEVTRFRRLEEGDFVAAKISSQDLWILSRVAKPWEAMNLSPRQLLGLSEAKRDNLLSKEKVHIRDSDDAGLKEVRQIGRQHVLPLPRSLGEASLWQTRIRKGSRVYAMYPDTTSLYSATVVDASTWCRKDDDIIVCEFDGDEDEDGVLPQRHISSRFVTPIPREYQRNKKRKSNRGSTTLQSDYWNG
mmetsp:Transcript_23644/g.55931  ORF Transcript_23644/g.55931 Transcript_23644/m.55931 type:complete len:1353 (+) Transcript_23644:352-4410(+)